MQLRRPSTPKQSGFSVMVVLLVVLVVAALAATCLVLYQRQMPSSARNTNAVTSSPSPNASGISSMPAQAGNTNWPVYSNKKYGFSYSYPTDWATTGDATADPNASATRQEFGTGLTFKTGPQNYPTVDSEVLDEPLQTAAAWYDQYYGQSTIKVNKTTDDLKGRQSVQYDFLAPTYESKRYLFAVGSKTYMFSSVYESVNVSTHPSYWSDFSKVFDSLTIGN